MTNSRIALRIAAFLSTLVAAAGLSVVVAPAALASTSNCPSGNFCAWDPNAFSGSPFLTTSYTGSSEINIPDNILSSAYNKRTSGSNYVGWNDAGGFWVVVFSDPPNGGSDLYSAGANNVTDFIHYG